MKQYQLTDTEKTRNIEYCKENENGHHGSAVKVGPSVGRSLHKNVDDQKELNAKVIQFQNKQTEHGPKEVSIIVLSNACVQPHAVVIKVVHTFVAKFAVHGMFGHLSVTNPTLFEGLVNDGKLTGCIDVAIELV